MSVVYYQFSLVCLWSTNSNKPVGEIWAYCCLLEKLETLSLIDVKSKKVAENIYRGLDSVTKPSEYQLSFINELSLEARQALLSATPWVLFTLFFVPGVFRRDTEASNSIWALVFIGLLVGVIGYFVPTKWGIWMYPLVGNFLFAVVLAWYGNRIKAK